MRFSTAVFWQEGRGLQSKAGPIDGRGSEAAWIVEPLAQLRVRQSPEVVHEAFVGIDVVSSASADALDAVSTASAHNGAVTVEVTTSYASSDGFSFGVRYGAHAEEPLRGVTAGPILTYSFAEENTILEISGFVIADGFDDLQPSGKDLGFNSRTTLNGNVSLSQVLSPTTLLDLSFGATEQWGVLENTWNSVIVYREPGEKGDPIHRIGERFPRTRNRNAVGARLSQHIPATGTTLKGSYRFYFDENDVLAHTTEVALYQYLVPWLYVRGHYRLHVQPEFEFYFPYLRGKVDPRQKRTSDSDLEELTSREAGARISLVRDRAPAALRSTDSFDLTYFRYWRSNDLRVDYGALGYSRTFQ